MVRTLAWESKAGSFAAGCSSYERTAEPRCCGSGASGCKDLTTVRNSEGTWSWQLSLSCASEQFFPSVTSPGFGSSSLKLQNKSYFSFLALVVILPLQIQSTDPSLMATACSRF